MNLKDAVDVYKKTSKEAERKISEIKSNRNAKKEIVKKILEDDILKQTYEFKRVKVTRKSIFDSSEKEYYYPVLNIKEGYEKKDEVYVIEVDEFYDEAFHIYTLIDSDGQEIKVVEKPVYKKFKDKDGSINYYAFIVSYEITVRNIKFCFEQYNYFKEEEVLK